ncbi:TadE/TadG family type IV pilus assembly protein [Bradyrhizobium sp.]|uniref:TadE/TadG family type IV pilus assembly protein n=1 Tax=Bradyrhizobium sp. TaxID=376 RepID=UPI001EBD7E7C|nr:TadE/TadG family type IV pilus assembly protein [Bradyrhizobium sp.]MBV9983805.1 pilus assembly protein [Bradyrhizobium sp.]
MTEVEIALGSKRRNRCAALIADSKGATAVEFALVAAPFLALIVALIQTFLVFFAQELLESVVQKSSRLILTGQVQSQQMKQDDFKKAVCNQIVILFTCDGLMVDVQVANTWSSANTSTPTLSFKPDGTVANSWQFNAGSTGDIVVVRVMYQWPVFLGPLGFNLANLSNGNRLIMASAAFQNEPS